MEEKKKNNVGLIVLVVILLLTCIGMGTLIFVNRDKIMTKESTTISETEKNKTNSNTEKEIKQDTEKEKGQGTEKATDSSASLKYCEGTYTYNDNIPVGDGELHKQVRTLKNDGTFSGSRNDTTKDDGTYIIKDDTIIFIYHPETYGGPDNASYTSTSYYISSDCSYMSYEYRKNDGTPVKIKLTK